MLVKFCDPSSFVVDFPLSIRNDNFTACLLWSLRNFLDSHIGTSPVTSCCPTSLTQKSPNGMVVRKLVTVDKL